MASHGPFALPVLLVALYCATLTAASSKLPSTFKRCYREDPRLNQCLREAVGDAFRKMKDGIPNLGVLPSDPLKVNEIKIDQGQGPVSLSMHLTDIVIKGLANTRMLNYSALLDQAVLDTASITPSLTVDFTHELNGRILLLPVRGAGPGRMTLTDLITNHYLKFDRKERKDGKAYWSMKDYQVRFDTKGISMDFKGLFGASGDSRLGEQLNSFIKQNSRLMFDELRPSFEDAFSAVFKAYTSRIFDKVPVDDIFLPGKGP